MAPTTTSSTAATAGAASRCSRRGRRFGYAVVYDLTRSPLGETTLDAELDAQYGRDEEACLLAADLVLAPTPAAVKALQGRGRPERVMLSPPGVDVDRFDWDEPRSRAASRASSTSARSIRAAACACSSARWPRSSARSMPGSCSRARSSRRKFEQALRDGIRELGLADKIEMLGPVDHDQLPALTRDRPRCASCPRRPISRRTRRSSTRRSSSSTWRASRAIVAPRRDTVARSSRTTARRCCSSPAIRSISRARCCACSASRVLRDRIAQQAYERVRRDFTASAARRALRTAYSVIARAVRPSASDCRRRRAPKVEMLADDDFEATVFEERAELADRRHRAQSIEDPERSTTTLARRPHDVGERRRTTGRRRGQTMERDPVARRRSRASAGAAGQDEWTSPARACPRTTGSSRASRWPCDPSKTKPTRKPPRPPGR